METGSTVALGSQYYVNTGETPEEVRDGILVRRSPQFTYYNKIDRLRNWKGALLGGHKPPPEHLVATPG